MAKFESSTFGRISGRHGSAVAAKYNDKNIIRIYSPPSDPKTPKQLAQRAKFSLYTHTLRPLKTTLDQGYGCHTGIAESMKTSFNTCIAGSYPNFTFDFSKLRISNGNLPQTEVAHLVKKTGTIVSADWDSTLFFGASAKDTVNFVFFNPTTQNTFLSTAAAIRSAAKVDITLPAAWTGATLHCWMYFTSPLTANNSASTYLAKLTL